MFKKTVPAILATALLATTALASENTVSDASKASITTALTDQGYTVSKIEAEDDRYEVKAMKDGKAFEVYLDGAYKIIRTENDD